MDGIKIEETLARMPDFLKIREVCNYLRISVPTVHKMIRSGQLDAIRVGKRIWRIRKCSIIEILNDTP